VLENARMPTNDEKNAFSKRLEFALRRSREPVTGPTELALRFNLRHTGTAVSTQTTHKWLTGRAIPTNDKLATLAQWLNVDEHWLHYGPPSKPINPPANVSDAALTPELLELALKIQGLPSHRRYLVEELIEQLKEIS